MARVRVINSMARFLARLDRGIDQALNELGREWEQVAREEIEAQPRMGPMAGSAMGAIDTGLMLESNGFAVDRRSKQLTVGNPLNYALYTTFGTWKMEARPWMQNSVLNHRERYRDVVADAIRDEFK